MSRSDPFLEALVTRLYHSAELLPDPGFRELLKNAALALLRAEDVDGLQRTLTLADSLLVTAGALGFMPEAMVTSLRAPLRTDL